MNRSVLKDHGIDCDTGVERCLNNETLYASILTMFLDDTSMAAAASAHGRRDNKALFTSAHELKGASGSAALADLYAAASALVECLRKGEADGDEVDRLFLKMEKEYSRAREGVSLALAD